MDYSNKLSIQQELKQYLRLTPEMRLRLDVLQATSLELKEILSKELEENPVIEDIIYPEDDIEPSGEKQDKKEETEEVKITDSKPHLDEINSEEYENVFPRDDFENKGAYEEEYNPEFAKIRDRRYNNTPSEEKKDLQSELKKQLDGLDITSEDYAAAEVLVSNIDSDGFLTEDISTISLASGVQEGTLNKMLEVIKTFEPAGVGARNVSESLMIQLRQKNQKDSLAYQIVEKYFDLLSKKEYKKLARIFKVSEQHIKKAEEIMKELSPYPGRNLTNNSNEYIVPDIIVTEEDGIYRINMAGDIPEIRINKEYLKMYKEKKETKEFIRNYEARIKAVRSAIEERNKTTVKVVGKILEIQKDFLGNEMTGAGLKPLTLKEIADAVGVHESTISRIVSRKYIQMPSGVFPLKKFFSGKLDTTEGEVSSSSIKEKITAMVENEDKNNPLTDMEIADILVKQGVNIARRTIAKYREQADIPAAGIRKRLSIKD
jgi:RNA polymerase sigma-54 factor